jgi:uncharacterized coiled-coil protein SlyX
MRSLPPCFGWFSLLATICGLAACGGGHDELSKRLARLQADLTKVQSHADRLEQRLEAVEMRKESAPAAGPVDGSASNRERPPLMVVKLEPGDVARDAPTDAPTAALRPEDSAADQSPRPMIRVYGSRTDVASGSDNSKHKR